MSDRQLGRRHAPDDRDRLFLLRQLVTLPALDTLPGHVYWYARFNQDQTGDSCVANGWTHRLGDSPRTWPLSWLDSLTQRRSLKDVATGKVFDPYTLPGYTSPQAGQQGFRGLLYDQAQKIDEWDDTPPQGGTSVRAGAKVLQAWGLISEYRWLTSIDEIARAVLAHGPVVAGTAVYWSFLNTPAGGWWRIGANDGIAGGHCYVLDGCNQVDRKFRVQTWGVRFWISWDTFAKLLADQGEACVPVEAA